MDLLSTFVQGVGDFTIVAIIGFILVVAILWVIGKKAYSN